MKAFAVSSYLLGLKLVRGYNVCNRHDLFFVHRKEVLWNVLQRKDMGTQADTHRGGRDETQAFGNRLGAPM